MPCPHCNSPNVISNGQTKAGSQRYRCKDCGKSFTPNATKRGPKPLGDRAMTDAEKKRRQRSKQKNS